MQSADGQQPECGMGAGKWKGVWKPLYTWYLSVMGIAGSVQQCMSDISRKHWIRNCIHVNMGSCDWWSHWMVCVSLSVSAIICFAAVLCKNSLRFCFGWRILRTQDTWWRWRFLSPYGKRGGGSCCCEVQECCLHSVRPLPNYFHRLFFSTNGYVHHFLFNFLCSCSRLYHSNQ